MMYDCIYKDFSSVHPHVLKEIDALDHPDLIEEILKGISYLFIYSSMWNSTCWNTKGII